MGRKNRTVVTHSGASTNSFQQNLMILSPYLKKQTNKKQNNTLEVTSGSERSERPSSHVFLSLFIASVCVRVHYMPLLQGA